MLEKESLTCEKLVDNTSTFKRPHKQDESPLEQEISENGNLNDSLAKKPRLITNLTIESNLSSIPCRNFPNCRFGSKCFYMHPSIPCKFGARCNRRETCIYFHPSSDINDNSSYKKNQIPCKFGSSCRRGASCSFAHATTMNGTTKMRWSSLTDATYYFDTTACTNEDASEQTEQLTIKKLSESLPKTPPKE